MYHMYMYVFITVLLLCTYYIQVVAAGKVESFLLNRAHMQFFLALSGEFVFLLDVLYDNHIK